MSPHPLLDRTKRLVFAHRGGAALRPENTIVAFDHGLALGADGLEFDVHLAGDGQVVVIHDTVLERTTNGQGPVARLTSGELAELDAGYHFEPGNGFAYRGRGLTIPRLNEVLHRYPDIPLVIELKGTEVALGPAAVDEVRRAGALERVCFGSFNDKLLRAVRACAPGVITSGGARETLQAMWLSRLWLPPLFPRFQAFQVPEEHHGRRVVTKQFVRAASRGGIVVQVWTPNDAPTMRRLLAWGVQAVITDRPDIGVPIAREFNATHG